MQAIRSFAKSFIVLLLGSESKPRRIVRGLASGYRICVSPADNLGYLLGTAEPHLQTAIRNHVTAGDTVYDIGANLGTCPCPSQSGLGRGVELSRSSLFLKISQPFGKTLKSMESTTSGCWSLQRQTSLARQ